MGYRTSRSLLHLIFRRPQFCMPAMPVGAIAKGIVTSWPAIRVFRLRRIVLAGAGASVCDAAFRAGFEMRGCRPLLEMISSVCQTPRDEPIAPSHSRMCLRGSGATPEHHCRRRRTSSHAGCCEPQDPFARGRAGRPVAGTRSSAARCSKARASSNAPRSRKPEAPPRNACADRPLRRFPNRRRR